MTSLDSNFERMFDQRESHGELVHMGCYSKSKVMTMNLKAVKQNQQTRSRGGVLELTGMSSW